MSYEQDFFYDSFQMSTIVAHIFDHVLHEKEAQKD